MKVYIRTDASYEIGTGHVMRCLTLAGELEKRGADVSFICRENDGDLNNYIEQRGFAVSKLAKVSSGGQSKYPHSEWLGCSEELDAEESVNVIDDGAVLIVDHYALGKGFEDVVKAKVSKLVVIDDLADRPHNCNLLIDQNFYLGDLKARYNDLVPNECEVLAGPKFAMLRDEFYEARKNVAEKAREPKKVFVNFGGVDQDNYTLQVLQKLEGKRLEIIVVTGGANQNFEQIEEYCSGKNDIRLVRQTDKISELMLEADFAIGAGGATTWERCALGLPQILIPIAENQEQIIKDLDEHGAVIATDLDNFQGALDKMKVSYKELAETASSLVDAKGLRRVASSIMMNLRDAKLEDAENILEIRNCEEVRKFSINSEVIDYEDHICWFESSLENENRKILIAEVDKKIVGVLRYDFEDKQAEVSIYLNPQFFGMGYGEVLLAKGENWLRINKENVESIRATVLEENEASVKLFSSGGYNKELKYYIKWL